MEDLIAFILAHVPFDDEPFTEQDREAVAEADQWLGRISRFRWKLFLPTLASG